MNDKQQTAVEWLVCQLQQTRDWQRVINEANQSSTSVRNVIEQAKEMEKEQIITAWGYGWLNDYKSDDDVKDSAKQYYEQTYK